MSLHQKLMSKNWQIACQLTMAGVMHVRPRNIERLLASDFSLSGGSRGNISFKHSKTLVIEDHYLGALMAAGQSKRLALHYNLETSSSKTNLLTSIGHVAVQLKRSSQANFHKS